MSTAETEIDTPELRKARGAFFTPPAIADYVARWAVREASDRVMEPSCGEATFLIAAHRRQLEIDAGGPGGSGALVGVELHAASAHAARQLLRARGAVAEVREGDFFAIEPAPTFDAVIGNPPYVRYQEFAGRNRTVSRAAALRAGVSLTGLASSWAAFTVQSALFLKAEGRLGLVLPAELLSVNYAAQVREFLLRRFARVRLVLFTERVFPGVLEEVVLLLAEGSGGTDHFELLQVHGAEDLADLHGGTASTWSPASAGGKWTSALVQSSAARVYDGLLRSPAFATLHAWGETTLGMVTGANKYFAMSPARARELGLPDHELLPLSPPGSRHLRGLSFTARMRAELGAEGASTVLFRPGAEPSPAAQEYIESGERTGTHLGYKCRVRAPWWRVPLVAAPDLFLTYMNADTPRLTTNSARAHHLNSVHGVYLHPGVDRDAARLLPLASLNSVTLLGAEIVGRAYGGGMLKIEPREADHLPVPAEGHLIAAAAELSGLRDRVSALLREGRLLDAVRVVDRVLLVDGIGITSGEVGQLEEAHAALAARRRARGASARDRVSPHAGVVAGRLGSEGGA